MSLETHVHLLLNEANRRGEKQQVKLLNAILLAVHQAIKQGYDDTQPVPWGILAQSETCSLGGLVFSGIDVELLGVQVNLSPAQFKILRYLAEQNDYKAPTWQLLQLLYPEEMYSAADKIGLNKLQTTITRLNKSLLEKTPLTQNLVVAEYGWGYRLATELLGEE